MEIYSQPTFNKGMVTVRQKNASDLSDAYDFVTWCENFTPNKIIGSLIKRAGLNNKGYMYENTNYPLHVQKFIEQGTIKEYYNEIPGIRINYSALNHDINSFVDLNRILGFHELSTSRPIASRVPLILFTDNDNTESFIASYYVRRYENDYYVQWNETFNMPNLDMLDEHKNHIHGIISDYDNIGDVMLFVSKKSQTSEQYYPVYVYAYNDGRRYVEHWFKPENNPPDTNKEYWHVRKNSQSYKTDTGLVAIEPINHLIIQNGTVINPKFTGTARNTPWSYLIEAGLFPQQSELPDNQTYGTRVAGQTANSLSNAISVVFFQSGQLPYGASGNNTYNSEDDFWYTVEALNTEWRPYENRTGYKRPDFQAGEIFGFLPMGFEMDNNYAQDYIMNNFAFPINPLLVKYRGATNNDIDIKMYIQRALAHCQIIENPYLARLKSFEDMYGSMDKALILGWNAGVGNEVWKKDIVIRTMLPKYRGNGTPRPYLAGEKIPFVLTAVINGTETELLRDTYIVQEGNKRAVSDSVLNEYGTLTKDGKIRLAQIVDDYSVRPGGVGPFTTVSVNPDREFVESYDVKDICWTNVSNNTDRFRGELNAWQPEPATYTDLADNKYAQGLRGQRVLMPYDTINGKITDVFTESGGQWKPEVNGKEIFMQNYDATPEAGYVYFTLRINAPDYDSAMGILPDGLTEFKLYFAEGDMTKGLVQYDDQGKVWNYSTQGYCSHRAIANDSNNYRLVKRFIVSNSKGITDLQYSAINEATQGMSGYESTNSWIAVSDTDGIGSGIYAVPNHWRDSEIITDFNKLPSHPLKGGNKVLNFHNFKNNYGGSVLRLDTYFADLQNKPISQFDGQTPPIPMNRWSSDFCLWDYPTNSQLLTENVSTENWDGVGAGLICVVNGVVVIGDLQDKELQPEDGIVRFAGIKNNVVMTDVFPAQNKYRIGKERHTALISWREQLLAFSETGFYKVMIRGINPADWILVDKFEGQGVLYKKHIAVTPQGIMFMNKNGVFVTDGQTIQELSTAISNVYRTFMDNTQTGTNILRPTNFLPRPSEGYMKSISYGYYIQDSELIYDNVNNELVVVIKDRKWVAELVFNLTHKNWHIRSHGYEHDDDAVECSFDYRTRLRSHFCGESGLTWIAQENIYSKEINNTTSWLSFHSYLGRETDPLFIETLKSASSIYAFGAYQDLDKKLDKPIWGAIITDTIGDGINDHHAFKIEFAGIPLSQDIRSTRELKEHLYLVDRVNMNYVYGNHHNSVDLFSANFRPNWERWFLKNSPGILAPSQTGIINPVSRESYVQLVPRGQTFRRCQLYYEGYELFYLESLIFTYDKKRRRWG